MPAITQWVSQQLLQASKRLLQAHERLDSVSVSQEDRLRFALKRASDIEQQFVEALETAYPKYSFETAHTDLKKVSKDPGAYHVRINALDGLGHYAYTHPSSVMTVEIRCEGELVHLMIYDFNRDEWVQASQGHGAHLNKRRLRVTPHCQQSPLRLGIYANHPQDIPAATWAQLMTFKQLPCWLMTGSLWLDACYLGAGRLDACVFAKPSDAERAGVTLLVAESGGVTREQGDLLWAANPDLIGRLLTR